MEGLDSLLISLSLDTPTAQVPVMFHISGGAKLKNFLAEQENH